MLILKHPEEREIVDRVIEAGQEHVFRFWEELSEPSRKRLMEQLQNIDFELLEGLKNLCHESDDKDTMGETLEPVEVIQIPETPEQKRKAEEAEAAGQAVIRSGKMAAFVVAGGQGTRLGFDGPKGCFPIGPVTGKSLFQMHAEKILAAAQAYGVAIPWYIMTSETNDAETRRFFAEHQSFGLDEQDVFFFSQRMMPSLDETGKLILDGKDHIFMSPNGHGGSLLALEESGALDDMRRRGIEYISYFQIDNVLIKVIDPTFIGYHVQGKAEMSSKVAQKRDPWEKVGVFGRVGGKLKVIEYSDISDEDKQAANPDDSLKYGAGNLAIHLINVEFVEKEVRGGFKLPYHVAHKEIPVLDKDGHSIIPERPNGYKFETFVFDALSDTTESVVMEIVREDEFSPVKNREGEDSAESAKQDLSNFYGKWLERAGIAVPRNRNGDVRGAVEISPLFAMDEETFAGRVKKDIIFKDSLYLGPE